jgi:hypothetical protein
MKFSFLRVMAVFGVVFAASSAHADSKWRTDFLDLLDKGPARIEAGVFDISLHTRVNVWGGWVGEDARLDQGDPMQQYGFRLRRARFGLDGHLFKTVTYAVELDIFDSEKLGGPLYEAWAGWSPNHWFGVKFGLQKFPMVKSEMNSSMGLAHLDRSIGVKAMAPGNTLGIAFTHQPWKDHLTITLGVFNGLQRAPSFYDGYEGVGVSLGNKFERLSYVGRIDLEPLAPLGKGDPDLDGGAFRLGLGGGGFYSNGQSLEMFGASGYLHMKAFGFHMLAETVWDRAKPQKRPTVITTVPTDTDRLTVHGSIGYFAHWINTGLAVRAEWINDNLDVGNEGDQVVVAASLSHYLYKHYLKATLEYQARIELKGMSRKNDAAIFGVQLGF